MRKARLYQLTVFGPALDAEHSSIQRAVEYHSDGDFVEVFKQVASLPGAKASGAEIPFTVAYLFSTTSYPSEMAFGLLDRDRYFLVEVEANCWELGANRARLWLERHREPG